MPGVSDWLQERLRLPTRHDPAPSQTRLIGICCWAAALGLAGLPVAGRASVSIMIGTAPPWFEAAVVTVGIIGIVLTAAAFASVHRRRLPWLLLGAATAALTTNLTVTLSW